MNRQSITPEEAIDQVYQYGGRILNEDIESVTQNAEKAKQVFGKIRSLCGYVQEIKNVCALLADYVSGTYTEVPWRIVAALTGGVIYVFSPVDLIPDLIPIFGFVDDAAVFSAVLSFARVDIAAYLSWKSSRGDTIDGETVVMPSEVFTKEDVTDWSLTDFGEVVRNALSKLEGIATWGAGEDLSTAWPNAAVAHARVMNCREPIEKMIGCVDMSAFQNGKEGFVLTRDALYFRHQFGHAYVLKWRQIVDLTCNGSDIKINGITFRTAEDPKIISAVTKVLLAVVNRSDLAPDLEQVDMTKPRSSSQIVEEVFKTTDKGSVIFIGENIPEKKRTNAHASMSVQEPPEEICMLVDATLLGSAEEGIALTGKAIYCKSHLKDAVRTPWEDFMKAVGRETDILLLTRSGMTEVFSGAMTDEIKNAIADLLSEVKDQLLQEPLRVAQYQSETNIDLYVKQCEAAAGLSQDKGAVCSLLGESVTHGSLIEPVESSSIRVKDVLNDGRKDICACTLSGCNKIIGNGCYFLNESISIGNGAKLLVQDSEIQFGPSGEIVLDGGGLEITNSRLVCSPEALADASSSGRYMIRGVSNSCSMTQSEINGKDHYAAFFIDGDVDALRMVMRNLSATRENTAVIATSYKPGVRCAVRFNKTSFQNCKATSQALIWAMCPSLRDCEFIQCESPTSIITAVEDAPADIVWCIFDRCTIGQNGAVVSAYVQGGSGHVLGGGVSSCTIQNCNYRYSHNVAVPVNEILGWVSLEDYQLGAVFFRHDGAPLKTPIGPALS